MNESEINFTCHMDFFGDKPMKQIYKIVLHYF